MVKIDIKNFRDGSQNKNRNGTKAQTTIFIIIAIAIVVGIVLFFVFREGLIGQSVPKELEPVYNYYLGCIENEALLGAMILGEQGGYIEVPEFSPGSSYMPFSNQLDFLGIPVLYWHYVSGNNVVKEQVPSKEKIENELNDFLEDRVLDCDFSEFAEQGFRIEVGREVKVGTKINQNDIGIDIDQDLNIYFGESSWKGKSHFTKVNSNLGKFYNLAKDIYEDWKKTMFLEEYGVDILRLYAPVDGTDFGCSSKIWQVREIRENLTRALEANTGFIKIKGDYYDLSKEENKYFVHDIKGDVDANINFLYLREWPMKMEVWPSDDGVLKADPVGLQEGLGMLGFCYVPYHFVYDFAYPVLIQMYYNDEMFQFPVVVYINKNQPREPIDGVGLPNVVPELCEHKNTELAVYTYNTNLEPVEAEIEFKCFDTVCDIGRSLIDSSGEAVLVDYFPQCVNGYVIAKAKGYETSKYIVSSVEESEVSIILDKKYKLDLEIKKGGSIVSDKNYAVVVFEKNNKTKTISYPEQKQIELIEGQYEIKVYVYSNTDLIVEGGSSQKCVSVPKSGVFGFFGLTEERCFDLNTPDQNIEFAVSGGGTQNYYIAESELQSSNKIIINTMSFGSVSKVEDLQENYNQVDVSGLSVRFE